MPIFNQYGTDPANHLSPSHLTELGAFIPIEIHVPTQIAQVLGKSGQPIPAGINGVALIDTGATYTCVHEQILIDLGLNTVGVTQCGTANGPAQRNIYPVRLVLPTMGPTIDNLQCIGVDLTHQVIGTTPPKNIIALLGRNLLANWVFIYNGPGALWTICW